MEGEKGSNGGGKGVKMKERIWGGHRRTMEIWKIEEIRGGKGTRIENERERDRRRDYGGREDKWVQIPKRK